MDWLFKQFGEGLGVVFFMFALLVLMVIDFIGGNNGLATYQHGTGPHSRRNKDRR